MTKTVRDLALKFAAFALGAVTVVMLGGAAPALADVLYATGFEAPTYTTGPLGGQNGWFGTGPGTVETTTVFAGTQAVQFNSTGVSGQSLNFLAVPSGWSGSSVQVTDEFFVSAAGSNVAYDALALIGNASFVGQIVIVNGVAEFGGSPGVGSVAITTGIWNSYTIDANFATGQETAYVNGELIGTGSFLLDNTALFFGFGINNSNGFGTGSAYADNLSITTPLPAALPLFASGLGGLGLLGWRRKRKAQAVA